MKDLERCLQEAQAQRFRIVVTDGVFSMDGNVAPMDQICDLAEKYDALVMVDESHSAGVVGATGHGVSELYKTYGRVDIYTGTLGKAFGGALRIYHRPQGDHRLTASAQPSLSVLQLIGSGYHRCKSRSIQDAERKQCAA